jgi:2-hydroxy-6-oxonona-2,4-dienedioate hydrolase
VPTLILSCEDDLFGTAETSRRLAALIPDARLTIWPEGGHIWLGHDADAAKEITALVAARALATTPMHRAPDAKEPPR